MKKFIRSVLPTLALASVLCAALPAKAGLYLEPYLGYQFGTAEATATAGGTSKFLVSGTTLGARVGYSLPAIFWVGVDGSMMMNGKSKVDSLGFGTFVDSELSTTSVFAVVGADLPVLLRVFAGYGFINNWEYKSSGSTETHKGTALKVGAGIEPLPLIPLSINVEYIMSTFDKIKTDAGESSLSASGIDKETANTYMLSVSLPFDL